MGMKKIPATTRMLGPSRGELCSGVGGVNRPRQGATAVARTIG